MPKTVKPKVGNQPQRMISYEIRAVNADERRVTVSFSSEQVVNRWYGAEILQHDAENVNLERLNNIGVALFNHERSRVIGKVENAKLDSNERRTYADIVFDDDPDSDLIFKKVQSGTLKGVSVGYAVDVWEEVAAGKASGNGRFLGPAYIATKWTPYEISIVSVPADDSVGVGRDMDDTEAAPVGSRANIFDEGDGENMNRKLSTPCFAPDDGANGGAGATSFDEKAVREAAQKVERQRVSDISNICREFDVDPKDYIEKGASVEEVRTAILDKLKSERQPTRTGFNVTVEKEEADKIRDAASDAIVLRSGRNLNKPASGAGDFRGLKLRDLAVDCLFRSGKSNAHRLDDDTLFREALTPDSQFAGILSSAVNKSMATAYNSAQSTYKRWTGKGSNPDFKAAIHYQISEGGDLQQMNQSGEFKFDEMSDQGVSKAVATFGRSFGLNRQALINDDISLLTRVPEAYVRAADRGINKLVYKMVGNNPTIYDNVALFHANHGNLAGAAAAIDIDPIGAGRAAMRLQRNLRGKETLNISPRYLLVPAAKETRAQQFVSVNVVPATLGNVNPFAGTLEVVADAELDGYSTTAWYMAASSSDIDTIEVTYLNGDDMPKLESMVGFDFLGIKWRIYIDYGVTVLDYRGIYKNPGL